MRDECPESCGLCAERLREFRSQCTLLSRDVLVAGAGGASPHLADNGGGNRKRQMARIGQAVAEMTGSRDKLSELLGGVADASAAEATFRALA